MAKRLQEAITRKILHEKLGWLDLEFAFLRLDDPDFQTQAELCSRMYSANALTPNEYRQKLGYEELDTPFADLTQFEAMLISTEAMQKVQEQVQTRMMIRQANMQQIMEQDQPQGQNPEESYSPAGGGGSYNQEKGVGQPLNITPANVAKHGQMPSPKPLALPKFPIAGSAYNARQIAQMPLNHLSQLIINGELPKPGELLGQMQEQEPGILDEMTDELRQFFEEAIDREEEEKANEKPVPRKTLLEWQKKQVKRVKEQAEKINDFSEFLYRKGQYQGKPGGGSAKGGIVELDRGRPGKSGIIGYPKKTRQVVRRPGGHPGNINPPTGINP
jgi:hypothetical protein